MSNNFSLKMTPLKINQLAKYQLKQSNLLLNNKDIDFEHSNVDINYDVETDSNVTSQSFSQEDWKKVYEEEVKLGHLMEKACQESYDSLLKEKQALEDRFYNFSYENAYDLISFDGIKAVTPEEYEESLIRDIDPMNCWIKDEQNNDIYIYDKKVEEIRKMVEEDYFFYCL